MAPLAPFGGLEWLACTSPPPEKPKKKAAPAPTKPAANVPQKMNSKINLWTQTPPGGLPPPPNYERSVVVRSAPAKKPFPASRTSRYWKKFYRGNQMLLREPWDAKLWAAFSDCSEPAIEPLRSKFWRKQFRRDPERLSDSESEDEDSCFDSATDSDDSDFVTDPETESDTDSDNSRSKSERKIWSARQRKKAMKRAERRDRGSSKQDAYSSGSEKHVHFSDTEEDPEIILKRNTELNRNSGSRSSDSSEDEEQSQTSHPEVVKVKVSVFGNAARSHASAPVAKAHQGGNSATQGSSSRANQEKSDKVLSNSSTQNTQQSQNNNKSLTSRNQIPCQTDFLTVSNNLVQFFHSLTVPTNFEFHQFQNLGRVQHPFATPLTQFLSNFSDFHCAACPFCFSKLKLELKTFYNPFLGHFISMFAANMVSSPAQARCIIPRQAQVIIVEHVIENGTDPKPNAFFDSRTGSLRVYHGTHYGNPTGSLLPISAEQLVSTLGAVMPDGGFGSFPSGFPVGHGHGFTDFQVARPAYNPARMTPQYPPTIPGAGMMDPRLAKAMLDQTVAQGMAQAEAQAQAYNSYGHGMGGMHMGMGNMNGMNGMGMNNLANQTGNMNMNSPEFSSPPLNNRNSSGGTFDGSNDFGGSNNRNFSNNTSTQNGGGGNNNNRNFSNNSNQNWNRNQNSNGSNGNGSRNASKSGGNNGNGNNRNQSRNSSQAGGNNNNRITKSNSGNAGGAGGGNTWGDDNAADTRGNDNNDSAKKNNYSSSNANNNNDKKNGSSFDNIDTNANVNDDDGWDAIAPVIDDNNNNDGDDWGGVNTTPDAFIRTDETVMSAGSWKSPENQKENKKNKKNNMNGYNLKQVNNSGGDSWGDPSAAQTTGGAGGW